MASVIRRLRDFNTGRDPERLAMKYSRMRESPFVFLRGTCHLFYGHLTDGGLLRSAPPAWISGDLHLENFGSFKGDNRLVYFDINDFDEAALAPASWDPVRLLTSVRVGADSFASKLSDAQIQALCGSFLDAYAEALALGKSRWIERDTAQGIIRKLLDGLRQRTRVQLLRGYTDVNGDRRRLRLDGQKALAVSDPQRGSITKLMKAFADEQPDPDFYRVVDVARRIAGTGSLGVVRYVILVEGKVSPRGIYLLDLMQALPSSLTPYLKAPQPKWTSQAHRVVTLQWRIQAAAMAFLQPLQIGDDSYVLRALQPSEDRIDLVRRRRPLKALQLLLAEMGRLVAWAQLRGAGREGSAIADELIGFARRSKWKAQLLNASEACAAEVHKDWKAFSAAYDKGAFESPASVSKAGVRTVGRR